MKIVPIEQLENEKFSLCNIHTMKHTPINRTIFHENGRLLNGFVYFAEGCGIFTCEGRNIYVPEGGLVYLPSGAKHRYTAQSEKIVHIRVDFEMTNAVNGNLILFSNTPKVIFESVSPKIKDVLDKLERNSQAPERGHRLRGYALLCELLSEMADEIRRLNADPAEKKILPGIKYIEENFDKRFDIDQAARLCGISESRFRAVFKEVKGISSLEYRERLRTEKACMLLRSGVYRMGEIADMLGYGSVYYFSRSFKKNTGISPSKYTS